MELSFIRWLRERLPGHPQLAVGLGDDAAVWRPSAGQDLVFTTDAVTDGVDFHLADIDPARAGHKALAVNLSDLAAMGAQPVAALVSLVLPRTAGETLARQLYEGMLPLAKRHGVAIIGGDTNAWDQPLAISVTAIGEVPAGSAWRRSGARPGDWLVATGEFGGSLLGKHLDFEPRVRAAGWLREQAKVHAALDVSDGLSLDLWRLTQESNCGAVLAAGAIPVADAAVELAAHDGLSPLAHALEDGEDFELLLALAPADAERLVSWPTLPVRLTRIGHFVAERGLWLADETGQRSPLPPRGFEHSFGT